MSNTFFIPLIYVLGLTDMLFGLLVAWLIARHSPKRLLDWTAGMAISLVVIGFFAAKFPFLRIAGVGHFGIIHLAYIDLVVFAPLGGLTLLLLHRRRSLRLSRLSMLLVSAVVVIGPAAGVYASFIELYRLQLEEPRVELACKRSGQDVVRVGLLADIQTDHASQYEYRAARQLMEQEPHIIVVPGDVIQGWQRSIHTSVESLRALLGTLKAPGGVYIVEGNTDGDLRRLTRGLDVTLLDDSIARVSVGDRQITIGGIGWESGPAARRVIERLESMPGTDDIRILVSHTPDAILELDTHTRVDLVLSGHTHGGQVYLPWFGPLMTASNLPRHIAAGGLHELNGRRVYISRGVGRERGQAPPIRFLCPPEITLLTLAGHAQHDERRMARGDE